MGLLEGNWAETGNSNSENTRRIKYALAVVAVAPVKETGYLQLDEGWLARQTANLRLGDGEIEFLDHARPNRFAMDFGRSKLHRGQRVFSSIDEIRTCVSYHPNTAHFRPPVLIDHETEDDISCNTGFAHRFRVSNWVALVDNLHILVELTRIVNTIRRY